MGYGFKLRQNTFNIIRNILDSTPIPHQEMLFPLLVPEDQFMKEAETVKGFEDEVYWVKDGGLTPLDVKLALRPTSETAMYPMAALWIRSHSDLPLKTYQIVNTFRYEGKNTRPLIRVREITGPNVRIQVDGGISPENAKIVVDYGADTLVAGSAIFSKPNIIEAINAILDSAG